MTRCGGKAFSSGAWARAAVATKIRGRIAKNGHAAILPLPLGEGRGEGRALCQLALTLTFSQRERGFVWTTIGSAGDHRIESRPLFPDVANRITAAAAHRRR